MGQESDPISLKFAHHPNKGCLTILAEQAHGPAAAGESRPAMRNSKQRRGMGIVMELSLLECGDRDSFFCHVAPRPLPSQTSGACNGTRYLGFERWHVSVARDASRRLCIRIQAAVDGGRVSIP
jgi:hypothetical protein